MSDRTFLPGGAVAACDGSESLPYLRFKGTTNPRALRVLLLLAIVALAAVAFALPDVAAVLGGIGVPALAMGVPALGLAGALNADEERRPAAVLLADPVSEALAGERAAHRVLRRIADRIGTRDELLGELRDVVLADGGNVPATPRLRAFLRAIQKHAEVRP